MKIKLAFTLLLLSTGLVFGQDRMAEMLRKGIVEEEVNQNLNAAIQTYQNALAQFAEERKTAAAALFRLADCYRKQGKKDQAIAAYKRVVQDFPDQTKLASQSRDVLSKTYKVQPAQAASRAAETEEARRRAQALLDKTLNQSSTYQGEARQRYRVTLQEEMKLVAEQMKREQRNIELGASSPDKMTALTRELLELQRQLAAFDLGMMPPGTPIAR
jgi:tetratricopeptide (TPR) repeat protein